MLFRHQASLRDRVRGFRVIAQVETHLFGILCASQADGQINYLKKDERRYTRVDDRGDNGLQLKHELRHATAEPFEPETGQG